MVNSMFEKVFVEKEIRHHPRTLHILSKLRKEPFLIDQIEDFFGRVKKPYLQKRDNLNLFIGSKKGRTVKQAPDAYGLGGEPHYYFIHAYNCIYECEYCYLQGYFNSPDMVFFINHEDIAKEMKQLIDKNAEKTIWFHAGEFSDSLALSHFTGEIPFYFDFFKDHPEAKLEFRTKSANTREIEKMAPLPNVITTFSLSPQERAEKTDRGCPPTSTRIRAMEKLYKLGHPIGLHLDPIIHSENLFSEYAQLLDELTEKIPADYFEYVSIGVVRFTKEVYRQVQLNYPESDLLVGEFIKPEDGKVRYPGSLRKHILGKIQKMCLEKGFKNQAVYQCMEN
jgi:spore photoproduct lyase